MDPRTLFVITLGVAAYNGVASPLQFILVANAPVWLPFWLPMTLASAIYGAAFITSSLTLLVGGVPAALFERWAGQKESSTTSCLVWLGGVILLTIPALMGPIG